MNLVALLLCIAVSAALALTAPTLVRVLRPAVATVLLTSAALTAATGTGFVASVLVFGAAAHLPAVAALGHWDVHDLGPQIDPWIEAATSGIVGLVLLRSVRTFVGQSQQLWRSAVACRHLPHAAGLVITADAQSPHTMAGFPGRVVVGAPVLASLSPEQRTAMIAHEESHLSARHHAYLQLVELAVAANPLLRPLRGAVRLSTERWADESAAQRVGDRRVVAAAITAAAPFARDAVSTTRLAGAGDEVVYRVQALLNPPRSMPLPAVALGLLLVLPLGAAGAIEHLTEGTFERAHPRVTRSGPTPAHAAYRIVHAPGGWS